MERLGAVATPEDTVLTIDPRINDADPDGDPLTIIGATATNGTVTVSGGTNLVFTPPGTNFNPVDAGWVPPALAEPWRRRRILDPRASS